jgi:hypothetical protein
MILHVFHQNKLTEIECDHYSSFEEGSMLYVYKDYDEGRKMIAIIMNYDWFDKFDI